ncbi:MAG TPA: sulfotransferase [Blastocatellia bacterium]|nr:sulfotransferase [Blastocatellia bacterium]
MAELETQPQPKVVCVLGMHRSGTSLLTGALRLLGVHLGSDENLLPSDEEANRKGFWENRLIVDLNDALLSRLGGDWHNLPDFPPDWFSSPEFADLRREARAVISKEFGNVPVWGWKDPRACLTLPFWRRLLPPMSYIVCLRNPVDVAGSLARIHGLSAWKAGRLWVEHVRSALEHTATEPRLILFYEDFIDDWRSSVARIGGFLGITTGQEAQASLEEFVEAGMEHHRTAVLEAVADIQVSYSARSLYLALRLYDYYQRKESVSETEVDRIIAEALNAFGHHSAQASADLDTLRNVLPEKVREIVSLNAALATKDDLITSLHTQVAENSAAIKSLSMAMIGKDATITNLEQRSAQQDRATVDLQNAVRHLAASGAQKDNTISELEAQAMERETRLNRITNSLGWRLLSYYGRLKYKYLLPFLKFGASGSSRPQVTKLDRKP